MDNKNVILETEVLHQSKLKWVLTGVRSLYCFIPLAIASGQGAGPRAGLILGNTNLSVF